METENKPAPRTKLSLNVQFKRSYARSEVTGTLKNLSVSGALLETPDATSLRANDKIQICFEVAGRKRKVPARIVWSKLNGFGIKFDHQSNRDIQIVDDLIYFVEASSAEKNEALSSLFKLVA